MWIDVASMMYMSNAAKLVSIDSGWNAGSVSRLVCPIYSLNARFDN